MKNSKKEHIAIVKYTYYGVMIKTNQKATNQVSCKALYVFNTQKELYNEIALQIEYLKSNTTLPEYEKLKVNIKVEKKVVDWIQCIDKI